MSGHFSGRECAMAVTVYGATWCPDCKRAKQFLGEQRVHYNWVDIEQQPESVAFVEGVNNGKRIIPTIVFDDQSILVEPSNAELAAKLGLQTRARMSYYDLIVVGGGPTGLTTALYGAREGLDVLVIERSALGGQAGVTERLDNFPGFPEGVSGAEFADRLRRQAERFGVEILSAQDVTGIEQDGDYRVVRTAASTCPARTISSAPACTSAPRATARSIATRTCSWSAAATRPARRASS